MKHITLLFVVFVLAVAATPDAEQAGPSVGELWPGGTPV
jgi:hypothetical protein